MAVESTHLKNMLDKMGNLPQIGMKIQEIFELPPPSSGGYIYVSPATPAPNEMEASVAHKW